jgi:hypothetical protein
MFHFSLASVQSSILLVYWQCGHAYLLFDIHAKASIAVDGEHHRTT